MNSQLGQTYTIQGYAIALNIYNFPEQYPPMRVTQGLRYLLNFQHLYYRAPSPEDIIRKCLALFDLHLPSRNRLFLDEMADLIGTFSPRHRRDLLDRLRRLDHPPPPGINKAPEKTVYADTQNVHNHDINQSVLQVAKTLTEKYKSLVEIGIPGHKDACLDNISKILIEKYPGEESLISTSITYLKTSTAIFYSLSFKDIFLSVWLWILESEHKEELEKRLLEELREMHGKCTTGHLARLVNVIQGFTQEETLCIKMSLKDQCHSVVRQFLTTELKNCQDEKVILEMTEKEKPTYKAFVKSRVLMKAPEWFKTYGKEAIPYIVEASNQFAQDTILK